MSLLKRIYILLRDLRDVKMSRTAALRDLARPR